MTLTRYSILAMALLMLPSAARAAEESPPAAPVPAAAKTSDPEEEPLYVVADTPEKFAARFGWWGVATSGSKVKTGEYQGLDPSSPFWDVDGLFSNGNRTLNFYGTGVENEATVGGLHYYHGPGLTANVDYERFPHRLDHKPPTGFIDGPFGTKAPPYPAVPSANPGNVTQFAQDLSLGHDYAIRVQELKANFKGDITENVRWRLNLWGMKKEGDRQATAMGHCYTLNQSTVLAQGVNQVAGQPGGARCHWLSQAQRIDWLTQEVEPVIEVRLADWLTFEYSRTMRTFTQDDQMVFRTYNGSGALPNVGVDTLAPYAVVPDNLTDIDRMKASAQIGEYTDAYVLGYVGNNHNQFRDTNRHFSGVDGRITNRSIDGVQATAYAKTYQTNTSTPTQSLNAQTGSTIWGEPDLSNIDDPVDRQFNSYGVTSRWRPFWDDSNRVRRGMALIGGYEYSQIIRQNASYSVDVLNPTAVPPLQASDMVPFTFVQPDSNTNKFFLGVTEDWSRAFSTKLKYTFIDTRYPLFGVTSGAVAGGDFQPNDQAAINSALPTHVDRVELCGTWQPEDYFMLTATVYLEQSTHRSEFARFDQNDYPWVLSAWYAPTRKWSFSAGYAQFSSFIDQDITLGSQGRYGSFGSPHVNEWEETPSFTAPWRFAGRSDVVNLGTVYALSRRVSLTGGFEFVRGLNAVATPPSPTNDQFPGGVPFTPTPYTELSDAMRVEVNTYRVWTGVDYWLRDGITMYVRYNYYDYRDATQGFNSGTSNAFLGGMSAIF